jgi:hypothetical protein
MKIHFSRTITTTKLNIETGENENNTKKMPCNNSIAKSIKTKITRNIYNFLKLLYVTYERCVHLFSVLMPFIKLLEYFNVFITTEQQEEAINLLKHLF